ncbi:MAG: phosphoribosylanthranilate isomerase [Anaerolineae bacterium]
MSYLARVKICCIGSMEEAHLAIECGANALGLVSAMPSGPGVIPDEMIARVAAATPPGVTPVLLTSEQEAGPIIEQQRRLGPRAIQLVDYVKPSVFTELRAALPGIALMQVTHITGPESLADALKAAGCADALLLDSGNPTLAIKELGGTGRTHNWEISREICERSPVPVFLAGGLNPDNVAAAIRQVRPYGVDICSGVRTEGRLDPVKLAAFMRAVRSTWELDG